MRHAMALSLCALGVLAFEARASESEYLDEVAVSVRSYHFDRQANDGDPNENNLGFHATWKIEPTLFGEDKFHFLAYWNTHYDLSYAICIGRNFYESRYFSAGYLVGAVSGYEEKHTDLPTKFILAPLLKLDLLQRHDGVGQVNILVVPAKKPILGFSITAWKFGAR